MLVSNDFKSIKHALHLSTQAKEASDFYEHIELGYNYRMSNVSAAIGVGQLEKLDDLIELKRNVWRRYNQAFQCFCDFGVRMMEPRVCTTSNYWLSVMILDDESLTKPAEIVHALREENIEARYVWKPLHAQKLWRGADFASVYEKPCSDWFFEHAVCLPSDVNMTEEEQARVISVIRSVLERNLKMHHHHER